MMFDLDKFAANMANLNDDKIFWIKYDGVPEINMRLSHTDVLNCYQMVGHGFAIMFDDWEYSPRFKTIDFYRRYVGIDGEIDRMCTGSLCTDYNPFWTITDLEERS